MEEWKKIQGSNDGEVSSLGRVKRNGEICNLQIDPEGYFRCSVGGVGRKRVHRFVAEAFLPNPNNLPIIDHIDGDKKNNTVENLRWVSYSDNGKNCIQSAHRIEPIIGINVKTKEKIEFESQSAAQKYLGLRSGSGEVNKVLKGKRQTTHGFTFYYKSDYEQKCKE